MTYDGFNRLFGFEKDGVKKYYNFNGHGDVTGITNSLYSQIKSYEYDAFGVEKNPDPADINPFRYCAEYYDTETGYIYLRARYYDVKDGRFISEDPAKDGLNWYVYCGNNPVNFVDPSGNDAIIITNENSVDYLGGPYGHTSAIYQDVRGHWFYTYWGNQAAAVIRIPDRYVKSYSRNGDVTAVSMNSLTDFNNALNAFLSSNGFTNITSNYTHATYIVGNFTASLNAAYNDVNSAATNKFSRGNLYTLNDGSTVFQGHNSPYNAGYRNCFDKTYASLSKGTLANGTNAGTYMSTLGFKGGLIPNKATTKFAEVFMSNSFTYGNTYNSLQNYASLYVQKSPWAQRWEKANYANSVIGW